MGELNIRLLLKLMTDEESNPMAERLMDTCTGSGVGVLTGSWSG